MCGVAGFSIHPDDSVDAADLARNLLLAIEHRGRDASGAAWADANASLWYYKEGVTASRYVDRLMIDPLARTAILHTRAGTKGSPTDNGNNHPLVLPGIMGVHNGVLRNDDAIFDLIDADREAEVDSEAIFALVAEARRTGWDRPWEALELLVGDASVAWIETDRPRTIHLARVQGRPLVIARTVGGSFLFASTDYCLADAAENSGVALTAMRGVPKGTYLRVLGARVEQVETFTPAPKPALVPARRGWGWDDSWKTSAAPGSTTTPAGNDPKGTK